MNASPMKVFLILLLAVNTIQAQQLINQRQIVLLEKMKRPGDMWPRGDGHIVIGEPGSPLNQKGYYEPGGSFSPSPGSFGLSVWVYNRSAELLATSDNIPLEKIQQGYSYQIYNRRQRTGSVLRPGFHHPQARNSLPAGARFPHGWTRFIALCLLAGPRR